MLFVLLSLCCCLLLLLGQGALSYEYHINSSSGFIEFSKNVSSGTNYSGTTVFLDADIEFSDGLSEQFEPVGTSSNYFQGTFDGQGYTISNLAIKSSSQYVGLFGYSKGATIRNVVLDSSCSVVSSYSGSYNIYVGGVVGRCYGYNGPCAIENNVNMGSVAFTGNITGTSGFLYLGGIAGELYALIREIIVRNCANYGSLSHSGTSGWVYIGGIVGYSRGSSPKTVYIQNSLNYGTITHNGTTSVHLHIGRILGYAYEHITLRTV